MKRINFITVELIGGYYDGRHVDLDPDFAASERIKMPLPADWINPPQRAVYVKTAPFRFEFESVEELPRRTGPIRGVFENPPKDHLK